jgi:drug/metabolite transporter (DMT)-like permease
VDAVVLACLAGMVYGAHGPALRLGLARTGDAELGALHSAVVGLPVAVAAAAAAGSLGDLDIGELWPFLAIGVVVPGVSQVMFVRGVRDIGASRALVLTGAAPLCAALAALAFLGEPFRFALLAGTLLVVAGGAMLVWEPARPAGYRAIGIAWVLSAVLAFAARDVLARWLTRDHDVPGAQAAGALLAGATATMLVYLLVTRGRGLPGQIRRTGPAFVGAGLTFGAGYTLLLEALDRGKVTLVSPLNGTYALWGVVFSVLLVRRHEAVTLRIALSALLVVGGAALVAATR